MGDVACGALVRVDLTHIASSEVRRQKGLTIVLNRLFRKEDHTSFIRKNRSTFIARLYFPSTAASTLQAAGDFLHSKSSPRPPPFLSPLRLPLGPLEETSAWRSGLLH